MRTLGFYQILQGTQDPYKLKTLILEFPSWLSG